MKNLVLGVAKGYDWYILEPFVNSFAKNCASAALVLFVDDISDFTRDKLIYANVRLKNFPADIDGIPNNTRWKIFRDFLDVHGDEYEQVFITDTRDVIFQADVFESFKGLYNWLGCVTEDDDIRGSKLGFDVNYDWLVNCFDKDVADKLADQKVICCGTVIGSAAEMKIFCHELWKVLAHKTTEVFDQAVTNYLVYNGLLPIENLYEINSFSGEIFTVVAGLFGKTRDDFILRGDGGIPAVVHQYDRHEELLWLVDKMYCDKNISFDARFTDPRSLLEQCCCLLLADKVAEVADVLSSVKFSGIELRNHVDKLLKIWKFVAGRPFTRPIEVIEFAVQNALLYVGVENFSVKQLSDVQDLFVHAMRNNHAIDNRLKFSFANRLFEVARYALESNSAEACFFYINCIKQLELPPDENFKRVVDQANRIFRRRR